VAEFVVSTGDHWAGRPGKVSKQSERTAPEPGNQP
jgi:hypothetical protein